MGNRPRAADDFAEIAKHREALRRAEHPASSGTAQRRHLRHLLRALALPLILGQSARQKRHWGPRVELRLPKDEQR